MKTEYGLEFDIVHEVNPSWCEYDKLVASCHLTNMGVIVIETTYKTPIDNEYDLEHIHGLIINGEICTKHSNT